MLVVWLVLQAACLAGLALGAEDCGEFAVVGGCLNDLVYYETLGFPLYGKDEELGETCNHMNYSFDCVRKYRATCNGHKDCNDECKKVIGEIEVFFLNGGLQKLQQQLCDPNSIMRLTYLDNYECLEDNADHYADCHSDSQLSQEFIATIKNESESTSATCCFFSWFQDCFVNITKNKCNDNATFFVSFSLRTLIGRIEQQNCEDDSIVCSRPPLSDQSSDSSSLVLHHHAFDAWLLLCFVAMATYVSAIK